MFFPSLDFPCSFSRMIDILKAIDESSSQHRIVVTYLLAEGRSWVFSSIDQFLDKSFSIYASRDNFVISFPSSTAHFNWISHEFSFLLASCLFSCSCIFCWHTIGVTPFNTLVRFVLVSLTPLLSHQSINYLTRKTVTISRQEEKIFFHVLWKKMYLSFLRKCASHMCNSMQCAIFSYFY